MLVTEFHGTASTELDANARAVFDLIVDVPRLPEWNSRIERVLEDPGVALAEGVEWVVLMHAMGTRWPSRSRVSVIDHDTMRFEYTSRSDDGNPSFGVWSWQVTPHPHGCELAVTWAGQPKTFWRRALLARLRAPALNSEVHASLAGLDHYLAGTQARHS